MGMNMVLPIFLNVLSLWGSCLDFSGTCYSYLMLCLVARKRLHGKQILRAGIS